MRAMATYAGPFALVLLCSAPSFAQEQPAPQPPPPPADSTVQVQVEPSTPPPQQAAPAAPGVAPQAPPPQQAAPQGQEAPPPQAQWVYSYPTGQWVYTSDYGWMWVPAGSATQESEGVPYTYLYTPAYGWTWYVSPWGVGPYYYGGWVRHPWRPIGWRGGWVAQPRVFVRLGGHAGWGRGYGRVGVGGGWHGGGAVHVGGHGGRR